MHDLSRRHFLQSTAALTGLGLASSLKPTWAFDDEPAKTPQRKATADTVIVLWMAGGMAHTETFDPKRYTPFEPNLPSEKVLSTFPAIDTAVDHIKISQHLEHVAGVMDRATLIRTHVLGDLGHILHSRHQYHWHTGYEPPQTVAAPHLGAWVAHALGPRDPAVPAFIDIGQSYEGNGEAEELKAFQTGGCLGAEYGPFRIPDPAQAVASVRPPGGMSLSRFQKRNRAYRQLIESSPVENLAAGEQQQSLLRSLDNANKLMSSPAAAAFDLSLEPKESYEKYNTCKFGQGCLLARRLTEVGARYIEVTTEYGPFLQWDTHDNGHTRLAKLKQEIDRPIAQLVLDLEAKGLLDRTLIVLASEFSRDMMVEGKADKPVRGQVDQPNIITELKHYGMHRHFTAASSVLMFGGGMKKGFLYGKTADERPCTTIENPVTVTDLHSTIYSAMGIAPDYQVTVEQRPFYVTVDGKGRAGEALFG
ncbi:MAG: DUF1501 domain-containing protein [Planctomycetaceae bacterium]